MYARYVLTTKAQQAGKTLDRYLQALQVLAKDCNYKDGPAQVYKEEAIRDT